MSVFTSFDRSALESLLDDYQAGALLSCHRIGSDTENSRFLVSTARGDYVLTRFEITPVHDILFCLDLAGFLAEQGIPCVRPLQNRAGSRLGTLQGKPAALAPRLRGASPGAPESFHCAAVGTVLARLHVAGQRFSGRRERQRSWRETADTLLGRLARDDDELLRTELRFQALYRFADLPRALIHADLSRDKVLFAGHNLSGIVDFDSARTDVLLYDLAIAVNNWCSSVDGSLDERLAHAFLDAYHAQRPLNALERGAWPVLLRAAALHFWLSRLYDAHFPRPGVATPAKDPEVFRDILLNRVKNEYIARHLWPNDSKQVVCG